MSEDNAKGGSPMTTQAKAAEPGIYRIGMINRKGGVSKTTSSILAAIGAGYSGFNSIVIKTDVRTVAPPLKVKGLPVWFVNCDATNSDEAGKVVIKALELAQKLVMNTKRSCFVFWDGGANRQTVDEAIVNASNLVIVPFREGYEDIREAAESLAFAKQVVAKSGNNTIVKAMFGGWPVINHEMLNREYIKSFLDTAEAAGDLWHTRFPFKPSISLCTHPTEPRVTGAASKVAVDMFRAICMEFDLPFSPPKRDIDSIPDDHEEAI